VPEAWKSPGLCTVLSSAASASAIKDISCGSLGSQAMAVEVWALLAASSSRPDLVEQVRVAIEHSQQLHQRQ